MDLDNKYSFVLRWDDLPDDLRSEKIDAAIRFWFENGDLDRDAHDLEWYQQDEATRSSADRDIAARFPMYF